MLSLSLSPPLSSHSDTLTVLTITLTPAELWGVGYYKLLHQVDAALPRDPASLPVVSAAGYACPDTTGKECIGSGSITNFSLFRGGPVVLNTMGALLGFISSHDPSPPLVPHCTTLTKGTYTKDDAGFKSTLQAELNRSSSTSPSPNPTTLIQAALAGTGARNLGVGVDVGTFGRFSSAAIAARFKAIRDLGAQEVDIFRLGPSPYSNLFHDDWLPQLSAWMKGSSVGVPP